MASLDSPPIVEVGQPLLITVSGGPTKASSPPLEVVGQELSLEVRGPSDLALTLLSSSAVVDAEL